MSDNTPNTMEKPAPEAAASEHTAPAGAEAAAGAKPATTASAKPATTAGEKNAAGAKSAAEIAPAEGAEPALTRNKYADKMNRPKKKLPKAVKVILSVAVIAGLVGGTFYFVNKSKNAAKDANAVPQSAFATRGMLETFVECNGVTAAKNKATLGKELKGQVTEVLVKSGDNVKVGDVLFVVNPKETRKELDTANAELADVMRAVDEAATGLSTAQKNLSHLNVTAPFSGKMIPVTSAEGAVTSFKKGQQLSAGTVLGTMVDDSVMRLPLYFNYTYLDVIKTGATATVSIPASMSSVSGTVSSIERVQKVSDDGAVLFRAILSVPNPGTLKKDMVATASVTTAQGELMPADSGKLEYAREEQVTAKISGEISDIGTLDYFRYGAGATICTLSSDETKNAVGTAQRSLQSAQKNLADKQTRIAELQKLIADSTVKSTIDGVVTNISVAVGDTLAGGTSPCTVADLTSIVVNASISELDIDKVSVGMTANISMDSAEGMSFAGTVTSVSLQASTSGGGQGGGGQGGNALTFPAVISLEGVDGKLTPDRNVSVKVISASKDNCITVPSSAVVNTEQGAAVFVKPAEGQTFENTIAAPEGSDVPKEYILVPVETGIFDDTNTEIVSGIDEGAEVFLAGPQDPYARPDGASGGSAVMIG